MKPADVCSQRLVNQHLAFQILDKPSEVISRLGAVQAQDYAGAKWGVAQRTRGATDADVEKELSDGAILRTHVLRPTWHFVTPSDIRWMLALTAPRVRAILGSYDRQLEIDAPLLRKSRAALTRALRDGKYLTRHELARVLFDARIRAEGAQRLARIVMHAELDGLICSGPRREKQFTYALLDERAPASANVLERDASLGELAARYFTTHGPATIDDFAWWSGLTKADARRGTEIAGSRLEHADIGGRRYSFPPTTRSPKVKSPIARLLPPFDEYFIGLKDRTAMETKIKSANAKSMVGFPGGSPVIIDGQTLGVWRRTLRPKSVSIDVTPLGPFSKSEQRRIDHEIDRYGKFVGLPLQ
jgi:hypothetical protein